jgi:RHS repeat-associated protein
MLAILPRSVGSYSYAGTGYANPHAVTGIGYGGATTTYVYDNNGNLTSSSGKGYEWDWRNRLTKAGATGGATTTYAYDHENQRVQKVTSSATTTYVNRYYNVASSSLAATTTKHIFSPDGTLLATVVGSGAANAATTYLHPDHLGGTNVVTDENGEVVQTLDYYPYGSQRIATGSFSEQRRFIGEEYDPETEFSYLNARYYQGSRGQFMSQDPVFVNLGVDRRTSQLLADPQQLNSYIYARGNPLSLRDPSGEIAFLAIPAASAIWGLIGAGFVGLGVISTFESFHNHFVLPAQYPLAFTPEQKNEAPIRFGVESALNWGSGGLSKIQESVLLDSILWGGEYVPVEEGGNERRKSIYANQPAVKVGSITESQGGSSPSSGSTYNYIYSKPFGSPGGSPSAQGGFGGYGFTTAQQGALQGFLNVVNAGSFDAQAFVSSLQGVLNAFGGSK